MIRPTPFRDRSINLDRVKDGYSPEKVDLGRISSERPVEKPKPPAPFKPGNK